MSCPRCDQRPASAPHPCPVDPADAEGFECSCCGSCARSCQLVAEAIAEHSITVELGPPEGYTRFNFGAQS